MHVSCVCSLQSEGGLVRSSGGACGTCCQTKKATQPTARLRGKKVASAQKSPRVFRRRQGTTTEEMPSRKAEEKSKSLPAAPVAVVSRTGRCCWGLSRSVTVRPGFAEQLLQIEINRRAAPPITIHLPLPAVRRFPLRCCIPMPYPLDNYAASSPPRLQERNIHDRTCIQAAPAHYGWPP